MSDAVVAGSTFAPLYVEMIRIANFRGIESCEVELEPVLTLLVGRNNAGKTRILRALGVALGELPAELDDLTIGSAAPATIDLVVAPPPPTTSTDEEVFDKAVSQRLGTVQTMREKPLSERFAWRTTIRRSAEGLGARADMQLLTFDDTRQAWVLQQNALGLTRDQRSLFASDLVETRRDIVEELTRRGSAVRRVFSNLEVDDAARADLEGRLSELSEEIVGKSAMLLALKASLEKLDDLIGIGTPSLNPLPVRLEELSRSVAIGLDTGAGALPVRLHGSGVRSLASLQIQGVLYERRLGLDGPTMRPHPLTLIEEPEAHLHPQASIELVGLLSALTGQVVASTHSSHLVSAVDPRSIRLIRQDGGISAVVDLGPARATDETTHRALRPSTHACEMEKLKRLVERPFGELLFASAIVIGDGATERAFLPLVIRHALGSKKAHGVCVIDPGSMASPVAHAAVKFAKLVAIPWVLFSDSDGAGKADAQNLVGQHAEGDATHVVWIDSDGADGTVEGAFERMLVAFDEPMCRAACVEIRPDLDVSQPTIELLKKLKGSVGTELARRLIEQYDDPSQWPSALRDLIGRVDAVLKP